MGSNPIKATIMSIHFENKRPCCPVCKHKGFSALPYDSEKTRIVFKCGRCRHEWTAGNRGGEFRLHCQNLNEAIEIADKYWQERKEYERER